MELRLEGLQMLVASWERIMALSAMLMPLERWKEAQTSVGLWGITIMALSAMLMPLGRWKEAQTSVGLWGITIMALSAMLMPLGRWKETQISVDLWGLTKAPSTIPFGIPRPRAKKIRRAVLV